LNFDFFESKIREKKGKQKSVFGKDEHQVLEA
jgi:hypothetical protein